MPTNQTPHTPGTGSDYARRMRTEKAKETARQEPSIGALIAKIAIGLLFIVVCCTTMPSEGTSRIAYILVGFVIGGAFIAWGILGYRQQQKRIEDAKLEVILSEPLQSYGNQELNDLAAKYDDPASGSGQNSGK